MGSVLAAVTLVAPDYDEALAFYVGVLGFSVVEDTPQGPHKRWVVIEPSGGGCRLLIAKAVNDAQRAAIGNQTGGRVCLFLHTDNFEREAAALAAAGIAFEAPPREETYGRVAVFRDPFGNRWDLVQPR